MIPVNVHKEETEYTTIDWIKCVLCQTDIGENLVLPHKNTRTDKEAVYHSLAADLKAFHDIGDIPLDLDITRLDEGSGLAETLIVNKACWHRSCRNKFNAQKLQRALKRRQSETRRLSSPVKTRKKRDTKTNDNVCFFCEKTDPQDGLHRAQSFAIDQTVRRYATDLNKIDYLLAKLSVGDMTAMNAVYHNKCLSSLYNEHTCDISI